MLHTECCLQTMSRMSDDTLDLTVTSPPYDGLRKYNGYSFTFEDVAASLYRVTKPGGVVVWVVGDSTVRGCESGASFRQALYFMRLGFNLHDTMLYQKLNFAPLNHNRYEQEFEYMFILSKGKPQTFNPIKIPCKTAGEVYDFSKKGGNVKEANGRRRNEKRMTSDFKVKGNIWAYGVGNSRTKHPAPFPLQLAIDHVLSWSGPGDLVYDPFAGSGTVPVACLMNGRKYIASETSEQYVKEIAKPRIDKTIVDILFR